MAVNIETFQMKPRIELKKGLAVLAVLALPMVAACQANDGGSETRSDALMTTVEDSGSEITESEAEPTSPSAEESKNTPHADGNPCEEYDNIRTAACELTGWVDLNDDGVAEPIGIATTGAPALVVSAVVDDKTVTYSPTASNPQDLPPLGPDVSGMESLRHSAFVGAFDITGEGTPEIVLWVDKGGYTDTFHVLRYSEGEFEPLDMPNPGLYGGGLDWTATVFSDLPSYRCTGNSDAPLEAVFESGSGTSATKFSFDQASRTFENAEGDEEKVDVKKGRPTVGLDCEDLAEHEPAPPEQTSGPGLRCPMGRDEPVAQSDDVGELLEAEVSKGDIDCDDIESMWAEYEKAPKSQRENGKSLIVDFGDHTCSTGSVLASPQEQPKGGCAAMDQSWEFKIGSR